MKLENDIIKLRAIEPSDVELLYVWENDAEIWKVSESITPFSRFELEKYIFSEADIFTNKQLRLMIDANIHNEYFTVGAIDLFDYNPVHNRAGIGLLIYSEKDRRKGYAFAALSLLIMYAFTTLNLHSLYCNISVNNQHSIDCFKKSGFEISGLKKDWNRTPDGWEDEYLLQLIKNYNNPPI